MKLLYLALLTTTVLTQSTNLPETRLTRLNNGDTSDATSAIRHDDNTILITKKSGAIHRYRIQQDDNTRIHTESVSTSGERGLLSTITRGNTIWMYGVDTSRRNIIRKGTITSDASSIRDVSTIWHGNRAPDCGNHVGGRLVIDNNNHLFVSIGDICDPALSQNRDEFYGKVLRMDLDGNPISSNPWFSRGGNARFVYARGLRNPFRMYYNTDSDRLYVLDVGQNSRESIYNVRLGDNYEWPNNGI